jgi:predicted ATP-binding protein involved in virulence
MKLTKIEIRGLFDLFDYDIPLTNEENLLIITGPNGFGKTMILNIIYGFFSKRFYFFQKLVFKKIFIWTDNNHVIHIQKHKESNEIEIYIDNSKNNSFKYSKKLEHSIARDISRNYPNLRQIDDYQWIDMATDRVLKIEDIVSDYPVFDSFLDDEKPFIFTKELEFVLNSLDVHIIKEQRLLRRNPIKRRSSFSDRNEVYVIDTITEYAQELRSLISSNLQESFTTSQRLDSSFPKRLLGEKGSLSKEEFDIRFQSLKEKQEKLKLFGLSQSEQDVPSYNEENAKVLLVYLKDSEDKIRVFDDLLNKLELFTSILNERRFTYKSIKIDRKTGFIFQTNKGKELNLTDLSSGEQHEVVLLYELIFKANPNTLVLIDEPEISLHVTWQKEFLSDLLKILELQKMQVIVATHSPQIINDRWDLVFNLETQTMQ